MFLHFRVDIKLIPWKVAFLILIILELFSPKVSEMFVYNYTKAIEYVKKYATF